MSDAPTFEAGKPLRDQLSADRMNALRDATVAEVVGLRSELIPGRGLRIIADRPNEAEQRCYVLTAEDAVALPGLAAIDAVQYDVDNALTGSLLGTLSGSVFTFTKPGLYLVQYSSKIEIDLSGATTATPAHVIVATFLQLGGVSLASTGGTCSHQLIPNFDGFVTNEGEIDQGIDLGGVGVTSEELTCVEADETSVLACHSPILSTIDAGVQDVATSLEVTSASEPSGTGTGTTSGQALVRVIRNTSGDIKILDFSTERDPTLGLYGSVAGGAADFVTSTISILKL